MTAKENPSNSIPIQEFTALKEADFFATLKQPRFSGQLFLTDSRQTKWVFYLYLGRLVYATGGLHPVRRWRRNLMAYLPHLPSHIADLQADLGQLQLEDGPKCWEYELLCLWVEQQKVTLEQAAKMIRHTIVEVLFDVTQAMEVTCERKSAQDLSLTSRLVLIDGEQAIAATKKLWQAWQKARIADRSPDMAPVIVQPEELQQQTSPQAYQTLTQLLDGQQSLRDLAVRMKRDVLTLTRSVLPYVQRGLVKLVEIPDLPVPVTTPIIKPDQGVSKSQQPLIACVDDSPLICQTMEKIIVGSGYRFVGINDALRAMAILLTRKPDLIFLDLVMPNTNGYEICSQLRKLSFFKHTPIVILTGNDGIVDRVRAKMVGSSDFVSKPVDASVVLDVIRKQLKITVD
jgi:chemotaxis family two-component system response regulator PixG